MRRREFICVLGGTVMLPVAARAQLAQKPRRIAFVHSGIPADKLTESAGLPWMRRFYQELRAVGYVEGVNCIVERYSAEGRSDRYAALATEIVSRDPDIIVSNLNDLVKALMRATSTIPIVAITTEPVAAGLISNLAHPGANLTGVSVEAGRSFASKRVQLLKQAIPSATKIAYLLQDLEKEDLADSEVIVELVPNVSDQQIRHAFDEMVDQKIDAAVVSAAGTFLPHRALIVELAAKHKIPMMYPFRDYAEAGGLLAYAPDLGELANRMASDVQQILDGATAGDIPYFLPTKFDLVINLKTARSLSLSIPATLLDFASDVIE